MRSNCALMYSTVFSPPGEPGARPSNSSDDSVFTISAKSSLLSSGLKLWPASAAASWAGVSPGVAGALAGSPLHAASAVATARLSTRWVGRILSGPAWMEAPILCARRDRRARSVLVARRGRRGIAPRLGAGDRTDACALVHVQHHVAFEHQRAIHGRAR